MQSSSSPLSTLQSHAESLDWLFAAAAFILSSWPVKMRRMLTTLMLSLDHMLGCAVNVSRKSQKVSDKKLVHQVLHQKNQGNSQSHGKKLYTWLLEALFLGCFFFFSSVKHNLSQSEVWFPSFKKVLIMFQNCGQDWFALQSQNFNEQCLWRLRLVPI